MKKFLITLSLVVGSAIGVFLIRMVFLFVVGCFVDLDDNNIQSTSENQSVISITVPEVILAENDNIIVMNVGGKDISKALLRYYLSNLKLSNPDLTDEEISDAAIDVAKQTVAVDLMADMADVKFDRDATDYYNQTIALSIEQTNAQEGTSYEKELEKLFLTDSVYRYVTRNSMLTSLLFNEYTSETGANFTPVTDSEILDLAKREYVRVKHVLVKTDDIKTQEELDAAKALAENIRDRATAGENFEDLVETYSADGMDVEKGYYFTTGKMVPEFETASFMISVGNVAMIESTYGYHIIKKYEMLDEHLLGDASIRAELESAVQSKKFVDKIKETQDALEYTLGDNYESAVSEILSSVSAG